VWKDDFGALSSLFKHLKAKEEISLIINQGRGVYNNALVYINMFA
jgi:hypothetical protein